MLSSFILSSVRRPVVRFVLAAALLAISSRLFVFSLSSESQYAVFQRIPSHFSSFRIASKPVSQPLVELALDGSWKDGHKGNEFNQREMAHFNACLSGGPCPGNRKKLILLAWNHFGHTLGGDMQGENVWCDTLMDVMHALGYTMIYAQNTARLMELYREYHEHVHAILWQREEWHSSPCLRDPTCVNTDTVSPGPPPPPNATHVNIPVWKIFNMSWWKYLPYPLGNRFNLSPENYTAWPSRHSEVANTYIGYSLEKTCLRTPYVPFDERPKQVYVFAKFLKLFLYPQYILADPSGNRTKQVSDDFYARMSEKEGITFLGQFKRMEVPDEIEAPLGINIIPRMLRPEFQRVVASSRVLMGIGHPALSPTPWEALCLGVPFIHPIIHWDPKNPDNKNEWRGQHDALIHYGLDEPYVYHVKVGDRVALEKAIEKAMQTPIPRYIPPNMEMSAFVERVKTWLETDWKPIAHEHIAEHGWKP